MSQFNIDEIEKRTLSGLKDFQRATVERVDYLFRHNQNRVLVADEVGMGKTLIARGAIVKTARLRIEEKDDLFKVIYICSNQNIANQNIRKLDVTGKNAIGSVSDTRLSMQHLKITEQENDPQIKEGFIQLIPLTPETSFRMTTGGGSVQERALMYAILRRMPDFKGHVTSLEKFMIMDAVKAWDGWAKWNFENRVAECEKMTKGVYPQNVIEKILNYQEYESIRDMLLNHLHERRYNKQLTYSNYYVMNKLRVMFARISVSMLEPDLVIMDEFQRFKFLLSSDDSELGILAHSFLSGHDTRVLLLSATPYKLYSTLEEIDENQLDEHYAEFFQVMNFLFDDEVKDIKFKEVWKNYSHALSELKAGDSAIIRMKELAENAMYQGVSRTERISVMDSGDYTDDSSVKHHLQIDENDINSYIQMSRLLSKTDSNHSLPVDYAKSCPYLMSFMKKYKIKEQIEKYYIKHPDEFGSEREQCLLWLNRNKINKYDELPKTNARLEALKEKAFTGGAEKYLWIPPSLPYYEMQGAYKNSKGFSKILVFSAWEMVPRMIGALVSYEAERLTVGKLVHQIKNQDKKNTGYFADGSRRYPVARLTMPFKIVRNDITKVKADVIVNTANPNPICASGTDLAIYEAAGKEKLLAERVNIGKIARGDIAVTGAYNLNAKYIIHTVGPVWTDGLHHEFEILEDCYRKSLQKALELKCESIAFPLISTGVYGFPKDKALQIAVSVFSQFLTENEIEIILVVFDKRSFQLSVQIVGDIDSYIDANYVKESHRKEYPVRSRSNARMRELPEEAFYEEMLPRETEDNYPLEEDTGLAEPCMLSADISLEDQLSNIGVSFHDKLFELIDEAHIDNKDVWKRANLDRKHFSKIQCDQNYHPKKKTVMALCIALKLDLEQSKDLLARADWAFSPSSKVDLIVQKAIIDEQYDIMQLNVTLFKYTNEILGV